MIRGLGGNQGQPMVAMRKRTSLAISDASRSYAELGSIPKFRVSLRDYHNEVVEEKGSPKNIRQDPGAVFGHPTESTDRAVFWRRVGEFFRQKADTQPKRKSLDAQRAGVAPNPGRPELGGVVRDA